MNEGDVVLAVWFYCNHHTRWERYDSGCQELHLKREVIWGKAQPSQLYCEGKLVGRFGIRRSWKPCDVCISRSTEYEEEIREDSA